MNKEIRNMILELCKGKDWSWKEHIEAVVKYSNLLSKKLGADKEICEISAWLHDIRKLKGEKEDHHIKGVQDAEEILKKHGYSVEKIEKIKHCILSHSSDERYKSKTKEAKIVASADALSHFDNLLALTYEAYHKRNYSFEQGRQWLIKKYDKCWKKAGLVPEAREIIKEKYEFIMDVLKFKNQQF